MGDNTLYSYLFFISLFVLGDEAAGLGKFFKAGGHQSFREMRLISSLLARKPSILMSLIPAIMCLQFIEWVERRGHGFSVRGSIPFVLLSQKDTFEQVTKAACLCHNVTTKQERSEIIVSKILGAQWKMSLLQLSFNSMAALVEKMKQLINS